MDLSALTLTQLRYLDAVERHRSFRTAAEYCHVTQPALSMQVQKLEELVGFAVFDRSTNPIVPTERGARLIEQARAVLRELSRLHEIVNAGEGEMRGSYRLGVIPTLVTSVVAPLVRDFARDHPHLALVVEEVKTETILRRLLDGSLDGGIAATPIGMSGTQETPIFTEQLYVYLAPRHPLLERSVLSQSDLVDHQPWLLAEGHCFRSQTLMLCSVDTRGAANSPRARFEAESFEALIRIVDAGLGLTVLPELIVQALPEERRQTQVRPFAPPVPVRELGLVTSRAHGKRSISEAIAASLGTAFRQPAGLAAYARKLPPFGGAPGDNLE